MNGLYLYYLVQGQGYLMPDTQVSVFTLWSFSVLFRIFLKVSLSGWIKAAICSRLIKWSIDRCNCVNGDVMVGTQTVYLDGFVQPEMLSDPDAIMTQYLTRPTLDPTPISLINFTILQYLPHLLFVLHAQHPDSHVDCLIHLFHWG